MLTHCASNLPLSANLGTPLATEVPTFALESLHAFVKLQHPSGSVLRSLGDGEVEILPAARAKDAVTATLSGGRVCGNAACVDPGTYPHDGKTYKVKSVVGKTIIPATTATECDGVSTADAAALTVPTIAGWTSTIYADVGATPTADPTVTLLYGVVQ